MPVARAGSEAPSRLFERAAPGCDALPGDFTVLRWHPIASLGLVCDVALHSCVVVDQPSMPGLQPQASMEVPLGGAMGGGELPELPSAKALRSFPTLSPQLPPRNCKPSSSCS